MSADYLLLLSATCVASFVLGVVVAIITNGGGP